MYNISSPLQFLRAVIAVAVMFLMTTSQSLALTDCQFTQTKTSTTLLNDCTTDETLFVEDKVTFNGNGHTITAVDLPSSVFSGPVLEAGPGAQVKILNVNINSNLADNCVDDYLFGIQLIATGATIDNVNVSLHRGTAGTCGDGVGIALLNGPAGVLGVKPMKVTIKNSNLIANPTGGLVGVGLMNILADSVVVTGMGAQPYSQTGVALVGGAMGSFVRMTITDHVSTGGEGAGFYAIAPGKGVKIQKSSFTNNGYGMMFLGGDAITIDGNLVENSTMHGIWLEDFLPIKMVMGKVSNNIVTNNAGNGIVLSEIASLTKMTVQKNTVMTNGGDGIQNSGLGNKISMNASTQNLGMDIREQGVLTRYSRNVCDTSSGPPVDCP